MPRVPPDTRGLLARIDQDLVQLRTLRAQIKAASAPALSTVAFQYRIAIADLAQLRDSMIGVGSAPQPIAARMQAANLLYQASEATGQEESDVLRSAVGLPLTPAAVDAIGHDRQSYNDAMESFDSAGPGRLERAPGRGDDQLGHPRRAAVRGPDIPAGPRRHAGSGPEPVGPGHERAADRAGRRPRGHGHDHHVRRGPAARPGRARRRDRGRGDRRHRAAGDHDQPAAGPADDQGPAPAAGRRAHRRLRGPAGRGARSCGPPTPSPAAPPRSSPTTPATRCRWAPAAATR